MNSFRSVVGGFYSTLFLNLFINDHFYTMNYALRLYDHTFLNKLYGSS